MGRRKQVKKRKPVISKTDKKLLAPQRFTAAKIIKDDYIFVIDGREVIRRTYSDGTVDLICYNAEKESWYFENYSFTTEGNAKAMRYFKSLCILKDSKGGKYAKDGHIWRV